MHLIQFFLPLYDNSGQPLPKQKFVKVQKLLTEKFGGLTSYIRSPASGFWKDDKDHVVKDDVILFEVVTEVIDKEWWEGFKTSLSKEFQQEEILIRAQAVINL